MSAMPDLEKLIYVATSQHDELAAMLLEYARKPMTEEDRQELLAAAGLYRIAAEGIFTSARIIAEMTPRPEG